MAKNHDRGRTGSSEPAKRPHCRSTPRSSGPPPTKGGPPCPADPAAPADAGPDELGGLIDAPALIGKYPLVAALAAGQLFNRYRFVIQQAYFFACCDWRIACLGDRLQWATANSTTEAWPVSGEERLKVTLANARKLIGSEGHADALIEAADQFYHPMEDIDEPLCSYRGRILGGLFMQLDGVRRLILDELSTQARTAFELGAAIDGAAAPQDVYRHLDADPVPPPPLPREAPDAIWTTRLSGVSSTPRPLADRTRALGEVPVPVHWYDDVVALWAKLSLPLPPPGSCDLPAAFDSPAGVWRMVGMLVRRACDALVQLCRSREPPRRLVDRLRIWDEGGMTVRFDEILYTIEHRPAFTLLRRLIEADAEVVPTADLRRLPGCKGRLDRLFKQLPPPLDAVVVGIPGGGGYHLRLPEEKP